MLRDGDARRLRQTPHPLVLIPPPPTTGPRAVIHACTLEDESQVGAGAQVLDSAVVKKHAALAPGAVLTPGKTVPSGQLWAGVPAKFVRELTAEEIANIKTQAAESFEVCARVV